MKPLLGMTLLHTRPVVADDAYAQALLDAGATLLHAPMIAFAPPHDGAALQRALQNATALLLTSPRAVMAVAPHVKPGTPVYPLRGATLTAARAAGLHAVELPDAVDGASLGHALAHHLDVRGNHFTLPTSDVAQPAVVEVLAGHGAVVEVVEAYRTLPATELPAEVMEALQQGRVDAVLCMSPSAVDTLVSLVDIQLLLPLLRASPGDTTARAWQRHGLASHAVARQAQPGALVETLCARWPHG